MTPEQKWNIVHTIKGAIYQIYGALAIIINSSAHLPNWVIAVWGVVGTVTIFYMKKKNLLDPLIDNILAKIIGTPDPGSK